MGLQKEMIALTIDSDGDNEENWGILYRWRVGLYDPFIDGPKIERLVEIAKQLNETHQSLDHVPKNLMWPMLGVFTDRSIINLSKEKQEDAIERLSQLDVELFQWLACKMEEQEPATLNEDERDADLGLDGFEQE